MCWCRSKKIRLINNVSEWRRYVAICTFYCKLNLCSVHCSRMAGVKSRIFIETFFLLMLSKISEIISIWLFLKLHATLNTHSLLFSHGAHTINITPCFYSMQHYSFGSFFKKSDNILLLSTLFNLLNFTHWSQHGE